MKKKIKWPPQQTIIDYGYLANDPFRTDEEDAQIQQIIADYPGVVLAPPIARKSLDEAVALRRSKQKEASE